MAEAPAQPHSHDLDDKELDKALARRAPLSTRNLTMLELYLQVYTAWWLKVMKKRSPKYVTMAVRITFQNDIVRFFNSLTELLDSADVKVAWTQGDLECFDIQCKLTWDKWQTLKRKWNKFVQYQEDDEEEQKPVVVEAPKKRRKV